MILMITETSTVRGSRGLESKLFGRQDRLDITNAMHFDSNLIKQTCQKRRAMQTSQIGNQESATRQAGEMLCLAHHHQCPPLQAPPEGIIIQAQGPGPILPL